MANTAVMVNTLVIIIELPGKFLLGRRRPVRYTDDRVPVAYRLFKP